jgi:hypothetical protein
MQDADGCLDMGHPHVTGFACIARATDYRCTTHDAPSLQHSAETLPLSGQAAIAPDSTCPGSRSTRQVFDRIRYVTAYLRRVLHSLPHVNIGRTQCW